MDISSLLTPADPPRSGSQPAASPPPIQSPYIYVRRSQSGPLRQGSVASPLSQSMVSSSIPPHLMSPQQPPAPPSPMRSPSAAGNTMSPSAVPHLTRNPSSTPSMDTLADLAAMQNHQPPVSTPPVLLSRDSYESQLSPSTMHPNVQAVSVTSNPRAVDTTRRAVRSDFSGTSLPLEIQQQASLLATSIQERPSAFVSHVELIKILHQGFLDHVYPPSSPNAHGDPHSYGLLQDLRAARENMHKLFAMGEDLWVDCLQDESMLARTNDEKIGVINQCMNAVEQEYASTKLWKLYGEWVLHCFNSANSPANGDTASLSEQEQQIEGQVIFTWDMVLDIWRQAAQKTKWRLNDSHVVWDQYADIMLQDWRRTNTEEAANIVRDLFEQRLQCPHAMWDATFQNFSSFISNSPFQNDYEYIMVEISKRCSSAKAKWAAREEFESRLQNAQEVGNGEAEYQTFMEYLEWEQTAEKRKKLDLDLTNALFQRAELRYPSDAKLWEDHILWLVEKGQGELSGTLLSVLDRATRHCPWSGALWSQYLLTSERERNPFAETEKIKHKATNTGLLDVGGIEEVLKVHAGWCSFLRRRAFRADANEENEDLDVAEMGIRSSIGDVQELAIKLDPSGQTLDPQFRLERIYINFLSESGSWDSANNAFRGLIPKYGNSYAFWLRFYEWEMTRWRRFIHAEAGNRQMGKTSGPHYATAVLKEALKQPKLDWPEHLMQKLIDHCEDHEDVDELQQAIIEVKKLEKVVKAKREREGAYAQQTALDQEQPQQSQIERVEVLTNGIHIGKRKREEEADGESNKKTKNDNAVHQSVEHEVAAPSVEPLKRDREHATILVQNLPDGVTDTKLRQFFRDCGTINSLKMLRQSSSAVIEFDEKSEADFALSRSGRDFEGSAIDVYLASGCTLYVTNFPPTADEAWLRNTFEKYGEIIDIRLPSLKGNAGRRFCYVQFKMSQQAQAALEMDGYEAETEYKLAVHISDPSNKQQRTGPAEEERQVFVRNLNFKISEKKLKSAFSEFGDVETVKIPQNDKSQSKGYGFVTFASHEAAEAALAMDGRELDGREIHVIIARKHGGPQARNTVRATRSKSPSMGINGDAGSPSAMSISSAGAENNTATRDRRERTIALINIPDTVNAARIKALAETYGAVAKTTLKPDHQGAILEFTDAGAAGKAGLGLEGHEIAPGRLLKVVPVWQMFKEKAEIKVDKIQVGKKAVDAKAPLGLQSTTVRRPGQPGARRGGGLGVKRGLGFRATGANVEHVDAEREGEKKSKTNDEFRKMVEGK